MAQLSLRKGDKVTVAASTEKFINGRCARQNGTRGKQNARITREELIDHSPACDLDYFEAMTLLAKATYPIDVYED